MLTTLRPPLLPNSTAPAARANSVSSPPRPTFTPGWKCVPRWRMRISPAFTTWPPKRFTPRRCAFESRPLRVELAPFLCAMSVCPSALLDAGDLDPRELLAVALALLVAGLVLELLDDDLLAAEVAEDLSGHDDLRQRGRVVRDRVTVHEQHRGEGDIAVLARFDAVESDDRADLDLLLTPAGAHNCVNHVPANLLGCPRHRRGEDSVRAGP